MRKSKTPSLPTHVSRFIAKIASMTTEPVEVWLIGSRANGRARPDSDTDLLIFGPDGFLESVRIGLQEPTDIDCLVVYDGDNFQDPWQEKSGSLGELRWNRVDDQAATYIGTKLVPDKESSAEFEADMGELVKCNERSWRIWP